MFESHFGFSGPPFQLNADPAFFFGSRGHNHALAYMRFGVHQAEGFIVVTGEVGAGKTTLVRTLIASLEQDQVVAAQVVSTQLEAGDLLRAILAAFGVPAPQSASKAQLISSLEAFLTALAAQGRRALLVIDEAQNLDRAAVEELRMLSNFQLGTHGLLQSFLVGQPELRKLLQSRSMEQLRQRVIASCHLGPLDEAETRAYIEHRLRVVGWKDHPKFDDEVFPSIHRWTGGIPRRINRLCSRLLLGAYLSESDRIAAENVELTAQELGDEIGEVEPAGSDGLETAGSTSGAESHDPGVEPALTHRRAMPDGGGQECVLCWVDTLSDYLKAGMLAEAMARTPRMPRVVAVHGGALDCLLVPLDDDGRLPRPDSEVGLGGIETIEPLASHVRLLTHFASLLDRIRPVAMLTFGSSDEAVMCAMLAHKARLPLLRADAGKSLWWQGEDAQLNAAIVDRLADVLYVDNLVSYHALHKTGTASAKLHCVGDLTVDVLHRAQGRFSSADQVLGRLGPMAPRMQRGRGYGVVFLQGAPGHREAEDIEVWVSALAPLAKEMTLLWMIDESLQGAPFLAAMEDRWRSAAVRFIAAPGRLEFLSLLREADILVTTSPHGFIDEACAMRVPTMLVGRDGLLPLKGGEAEAPRTWQPMTDLVRIALDLRAPREARLDKSQAWDAGAAPRLAAHLQAWLAEQARLSPQTAGMSERRSSSRS